MLVKEEEKAESKRAREQSKDGNGCAPFWACVKGTVERDKRHTTAATTATCCCFTPLLAERRATRRAIGVRGWGVEGGIESCGVV